MGVYSNMELEAALQLGQVVCFPLRDDAIRGSSIDLTLGEWFYRCDAKEGGFYNPFDEDDVYRYFAGPYQAKPYEDVYNKIGWQEQDWPFPSDGEGIPNIPYDHPVIVLRPGERILAHTHEFVGIHAPGTTEMRARSTWGRNGIAVCLCAGWGDPGYINRWTMEILNNNNEAVPIPVGERIAQLIFHHTGPVKGSYGEGGKYQQAERLIDVVQQWTPTAMLPKSYKDERRLPLSADITSVVDYGSRYGQ
jgi:dCTP deaminase